MSCSVAISSSAYRHGGATNLEHDNLQWRVSPKRTALNEYYRAEDEYRRSRDPERILTGEG